MSETLDRTESVFAAAVALADADKRAAYLEQACAGDATLRGRVEALLRAHARAGHLLDRPVPGGPELTGAYTSGALPGTVIAGRYKLLEEIGEGGMGTVWVAEQTQPVRRKVALKLIKAGMDSKAVLARFEAERQALAVMDHPNIAKVLDGGVTGTGRPFFVMEYVKGVPITEYCETARLSVPERLQLFVQVCSAVQHAHQKGIIHRDLKPSNILVAPYDDRPVPKVIDFGLAKALHQPLTERTLHTAHEAVLGTPLYMSPEQAQLNNLDVDTRSDIYSLGVLLYELLTGTTPLEKKRFKDAAWEEIKRLIREEEPPKPSTRLSSTATLPSLAAGRQTEPARLTRLVRGELDWIVMKALEKDRARRYETANGFARDIERYQAGEPVLAAPPSARYRLRKFARKHRTALAVAAALLLALLLGIAGTTLGLLQEEQRRAEADAARADEARERALAQEKEQEAQREKENALAQQKRADEQAALARTINQFLVADLLTQAEPEYNAPADRVTLLEVLDRAADKLSDRFRDQPLLEASLRGTLGDVYHGLAAYDKAQRHWSVALSLRQRVLGADDPETYRAMSKLGHVLMHVHRPEESAGLLRPAAAGLARLSGADHPDALYAAAALGYTCLALRRPDEAISVCEQALARQPTAHGPDDFVTQNWLMDGLAKAYIAAGRPDKALPQAKEALEKTKATLGPDHPRTFISMGTLAEAYQAAGKWDMALPLYDQRLRQTEARFGPDHRATLAAKWGLGLAYYKARRFDRSVPLFEEIFQVRRAKYGEDEPDTIFAGLNLAVNYSAASRVDEAIKLCDEWLARSRQKLGPDHVTTQYGLSALVAMCERAKQFDRAVPVYRELLDAQSRKALPDKAERANTLLSLGLCLLRADKPADAESVFRECLALHEQAWPDTWTTFNIRSLLGSSLLGQKKYAEAESLLLSGYAGMKEREKTIPPQEKVRLPEAAERLAQLYEATSKKDEAAKWRKELDALRAANKPEATKP
jgi:serine/threonine protein kinase